jgi:hypothetical protein
MTVLQDPKVNPGFKPRGFLRVHVPLFLTANGEVTHERGMWHDLGEFVTAVAVVGSRRLAGKRSGQVACRGRRTQSCPGELETQIDPRTRHLLWHCPVCEDAGEISGWARTKWDRSKPSSRPAKKKAARVSNRRTLRRKAAKKKTKNGKSAQGADRS